MIIFKRRREQRINPLVCSNEDYGSDAKETPVKVISMDDTDKQRNSKYDLNNLDDKDVASIDRNFIQKDAHTKRKNKRLSDCKLLSSRDYSFHVRSPIQEKRRRISESDDADDDDDDDNTDHVIQEKSRRISESDSDNDDQSDDDDNTDHVQSSIPAKIRRSHDPENDTNELKSVEKNNGQHFPSQIPSTDKKKYPQKPCVTCRRHGARHDTRYYCKFCNVALCKDPCFREYHSI